MNKNNYDELNLRKFKMKSILPDATVLLLGKRRSGKCLLKGTRIVMYNGSRECIENVKKGDLVMGDNGTPRTVLETHNGDDYMYKITNQYNDYYVVNSQHILSLICTFIPSIEEQNTRFKLKCFCCVKFNIFTKYVYFTKANKSEIYNTLVEFVKSDTYKIVNIPIYMYQTLSDKIKKFLKGYQTPIYFNISSLPYFNNIESDNINYSPLDVFNMEIEKEFLENYQNQNLGLRRRSWLVQPGSCLVQGRTKSGSILLNPYLYGLLYNSYYKYTNLIKNHLYAYF